MECGAFLANLCTLKRLADDSPSYGDLKLAACRSAAEFAGAHVAVHSTGSELCDAMLCVSLREGGNTAQLSNVVID